MKRKLRYSAAVNAPLGGNAKHKLAQTHALNVYPSDAVFTFIPKNACSTMRFSLALANGCIDSTKQINWIHNNNQAFSANLSQLVKAKYTFVILRCPFSRLASAYLDKIVSRDVVAWQLIEALGRKVQIEDLSFSCFVKSLEQGNLVRSNIHWRPQVEFLVYQEYDDYFNFHQLESMCEVVKSKIDLEVVDARRLTRHGTDSKSMAPVADYSETTPLELLVMKSKSLSPDPANLYTEELRAIVAKLYKQDIELFTRKFGTSSLMF